MTDATRDGDRMTGAFRIDETRVRGHVDQVVRESVEQTLNSLLEAEVGEVQLKVPRLRSLPFETQIIERYRRLDASVEEALIEMYLAGVSVRRVEDITEALWGTRVSPSTVSELNQKVYQQIEAWRNKPIAGEHPYVYLDGISLKRSWGGEVRNVSVLVAVGVGVAADGYREVLGIAEGAKEDKASWLNFLRHLKQRGLRGVRLFVSDACLGLIESLGELYAEARRQRCVVHWYRNAWSHVPKGKVSEVTAMLKAIHAKEDREAALNKAADVAEKLRSVLKLAKAAVFVEETVAQTLSYMSYPREDWLRLEACLPRHVQPAKKPGRCPHTGPVELPTLGDTRSLDVRNLPDTNPRATSGPQCASEPWKQKHEPAPRTCILGAGCCCAMWARCRAGGHHAGGGHRSVHEHRVERVGGILRPGDDQRIADRDGVGQPEMVHAVGRLRHPLG